MTPIESRIEIAETGSEILRRVASLVRESQGPDPQEQTNQGKEEFRAETASPLVKVIAGTPTQIDRAILRLDDRGENQLDCAVVAVTSTEQVEEVWANNGRQLADVIPVDLHAPEFHRRLDRAALLCRLRRDLMHCRQYVAMTFGLDAVIGSSPTICEVRHRLASIAPTGIATTFVGPTGCGKTFLARVTHLHSERRYQPLVYVDFAALEADRQIARLFDRATGGAAVAQADSGTLLLENIDAMAPVTQERMLEFLKYRTLESGDYGRKLDIRLLSTSRQDLAQHSAQAGFNEDLRCRLSEITIDLPALAGRIEDIEDLTAHFMNRLAHENRGRRICLTAEALERLRGYGWPDNVRELESVLQRAAALAATGTISPTDLRFATDDCLESVPASPIRTSLKMTGGLMDSTQRTLILEALNENDWNYTRTAERLGIGRTTLWRKIKKYNLKVEAPQPEDVKA